jgi:hypothetical protein
MEHFVVVVALWQFVELVLVLVTTVVTTVVELV